MNTLARVLKNQQSDGFLPFPVPEIGEAKIPSQGNFIVPALSESQFAAVAGIVDRRPADPVFGDDIIQNARDEAARIIAQAEENRVLIEQAAQEKAVLDAGAACEAEVAARVAEIRRQLVETLEHLSALAGEITTHAESDMVELALRIAKKIVGREVTIDREIALTLVKVSLSKLHNRSVAEVHLNPEDFAFVNDHREKLDFRGALELVEDRSISIGGCLIHTETGDIDARIESQFDEIAHGLLN
jgi:flagellar biosynthesis/type III secretory pathway protein FliH